MLWESSSVLLLFHTVIQALQPFLIPICFVAAWALILLMGWSITVALRDTISNAQRMHQIPCTSCRFFTGSYHLKCTVHPTIALSEAAIDCPDHQASR
jgi:hypothetical protein